MKNLQYTINGCLEPYKRKPRQVLLGSNSSHLRPLCDSDILCEKYSCLIKLLSLPHIFGFYRCLGYLNKSSDSLSLLCSSIKFCLETTDLLSPSCFPRMFPFTFPDSFLIKAFSAFSFFLSSNLPSTFSRNVPLRSISSLFLYGFLFCLH